MGGEEGGGGNDDDDDDDDADADEDEDAAAGFGWVVGSTMSGWKAGMVAEKARRLARVVEVIMGVTTKHDFVAVAKENPVAAAAVVVVRLVARGGFENDEARRARTRQREQNWDISRLAERADECMVRGRMAHVKFGYKWRTRGTRLVVEEKWVD